MKLTTEQIEILKQWTIKDNMYFLPKIQLDRKDYIECNAILEVLWLKWNRWKKAHIIEWFMQEELENAINDVIETWEVETLKETIKKFQFYPTPKEVAEYLVELAEIQADNSILEPSAWQWNIVDNLPYFLNLTLIELNKDNFEILHNKYNLCYNIDLYNWDFLNFNWKTFDRIIANPPFSKSQDVKHILHMYELLNEWWRIVSVASSSIQTREGKLYDELRALKPEFIELPEWSFKESWTMVNSVIVVINK
jgi:type I restriction-modification system DNA methylase subunit